MTKHDALNESILRTLLGKYAHGMQIQTLSECSSTNTLAKELAVSQHGVTALITADRQSAGRGRMGRNFHSPAGTGVYFSLLFPVQGVLSSAVSVTCAASVAVMRAIRDTTGKQTEIKWVNDLLFNGKKVCGILTEAVTVGSQTSIVIGIGINLRPTVFPKELEAIAGTLDEPNLPREKLIARTVSNLLPFLNDPQNREWAEDYRTHSCVIGKQILRIENGISRPCQAEEIDRDGRLLVRYPDGSTEMLQSGEISVRVMENGLH